MIYKMPLTIETLWVSMNARVTAGLMCPPEKALLKIKHMDSLNIYKIQ